MYLSIYGFLSVSLSLSVCLSLSLYLSLSLSLSLYIYIYIYQSLPISIKQFIKIFNFMDIQLTDKGEYWHYGGMCYLFTTFRFGNGHVIA